MKRKEDKGDKYIKSIPKFQKWINECLRCHRKGYNPSMPEHIGGEYSMGAFFIKKYFEPLELDEEGLCNFCKGLKANSEGSSK